MSLKGCRLAIFRLDDFSLFHLLFYANLGSLIIVEKCFTFRVSSLFWVVFGKVIVVEITGHCFSNFFS